MLKNILNTYAFNLQFANMLMGDIDDTDIANQPYPNANHPAWLIGHLAQVSNFGCTLLGQEDALGADWTAKYGQGSTPTANRADYPSKDELLATFSQQHERLSAAITNANAATLAAPTPHKSLAAICPTLGDTVTFITTTHEATHLGQLSAWRRANGKPHLL